MEGFEGFGQLGEPITLTSVGAAMGVLAGIVASLKQIGNIFTNKSEGSKDFDEKTNEAAENNLPVPGTTPVPLPEASSASPTPITQQSSEEGFKRDEGSSNATEFNKSSSDDYSTTNNSIVSPNENNNPMPSEKDDSLLPVATSGGTNAVATNNTTPTKNNFWDKNKSWLKPVAIGVGGVSLIAIGFSLLKPKHSPTRPSPRSSSLSGIPKQKRKKHHRKKKTTKPKHTKKKAVALL